MLYMCNLSCAYRQKRNILETSNMNNLIVIYYNHCEHLLSTIITFPLRFNVFVFLINWIQWVLMLDRKNMLSAAIF